MVSPPISLRAAYAMSGTDIAYGAICLRVLRHVPLARASAVLGLAMSGTELAYSAILSRY
eukprot:2459542-Rhodomonas_salina.1